MSARLSLAGEDRPASAGALRELLARGPVWVWIRDDDPALRPYARRDDAVELVPGDGPGRLAVRDDAGEARLVRGAVGFARVRRIWRDHLEAPLDAPPWRELFGRPRAWQAAWALWRARLRLEDLAAQLRPTPSAAAMEAQEAELYAAPELHEAYVRVMEGGLYDVEREIARRWFRAGDRLLDVGCGTGREAFGFAREGLRVVGADVCAKAIARAAARAAGWGAGAPEFRRQAVRDLAEPPGAFDGAYVSSGVYQNIPGRDNRVAFLRRCRELVRPGGVVVVAATISPRRRPHAWLLLDLPRALGRRARLPLKEPGDRWVREWGPEAPVVRSFRHAFFDRAELAAEVADAGLGVAEEREGFWVLAVPGARAEARYARRADVTTQPDGAALVLVQLSDGVVFSLNGAGRAIWELADEGLTVAEIAERLHRQRGVPLDVLRRDAAALLDELCARRLLEVRAP